MRQWTWSSLVQIMDCRLFGAKPLPEPMLAYWQLDSWEQVSVKFKSEFCHFHSRKFIWKCHTIWVTSTHTVHLLFPGWYHLAVNKLQPGADVWRWRESHRKAGKETMPWDGFMYRRAAQQEMHVWWRFQRRWLSMRRWVNNVYSCQ